jgi:hypothetical protein
MMPPGSMTGGATIKCHSGRTYTAAPGGTLDVPDFDAVVLEANGWVKLAYVGTTAQRPVNPIKGLPFIDTTLSKVCVHEGSNWRDLITAVIE